MEHLWAPWRMKYINCAKKNDEGCIFCNKPKEEDLKKNYILEKTDLCFVIFNIYPYNNGHLMVAPLRHLKNLNELTDEETEEIFNLLKKWEKILMEKLNPHAFNIGANIGRAAGAGFEHLHFHIVPRWNGDSNFMPVISDTKILNMSLDELYDLLTN
ncbi:MAG: HIT domain-containing protein [Armatimonadota bacterium]